MPQYEVELKEVVSLMVVVEADSKTEAYDRGRAMNWIWQAEAGQDVERVTTVRGSARLLAPAEEVDPQ